MPILSRNRHRLIARLLPLVLLVAQLGAVAHAYSHVGTNPDGIPNSTQTCAADHGIPATVASAAGEGSLRTL